MSRLRYPRPALAGDYLRGGAGLLLTGLPLLALPLSPWVAPAFAAAALVFALFTARTVQRQLTIVELGEEGIAAHGPLGAAIRWQDLARLKLRYFSTRRDRERGWMQLTLQGTGQGIGRRLTLESTLDGFDAVVERAAAAACANRLALDPATLDNLAALGIEPAAEAATPGGTEKGWFAGLARGPDTGRAERPGGAAGR